MNNSEMNRNSRDAGSGEWERRYAEPILTVEGRQFDLENLFPNGVAPGGVLEADDGDYRTELHTRRCHRPQSVSLTSNWNSNTTSLWKRETARTNRPTISRERLYPNVDHLINSDEIESAESVFRRTSRRSTMPATINRIDNSNASCEVAGTDSPSRRSRPSKPNSAWSGEKDGKRKATVGLRYKKTSDDEDDSESANDNNEVIRRISPPMGYILRSRSSSPVVPPRDRQRSFHQQKFQQQHKHEEKEEVVAYDQEPAVDEPVDQTTDQSIQPNDDDPPMVEVAPGMFLELRGARETRDAIEEGFAICVTCVCCQGTLQCVPDAKMVICQECRVVSLVEEAASSSSARPRNRKYQRLRRGVGLGLKMVFDQC